MLGNKVFSDVAEATEGAEDTVISLILAVRRLADNVVRSLWSRAL